jgi:hypothetical protein
VGTLRPSGSATTDGAERERVDHVRGGKPALAKNTNKAHRARSLRGGKQPLSGRTSEKLVINVPPSSVLEEGSR